MNTKTNDTSDYESLKLMQDYFRYLLIICVAILLIESIFISKEITEPKNNAFLFFSMSGLLVAIVSSSIIGFITVIVPYFSHRNSPSLGSSALDRTIIITGILLIIAILSFLAAIVSLWLVLVLNIPGMS